MAKNRPEIIQEIRDWNGMLSNVQNIPLNSNYNYKNENDLYERLTAHIKGFVEGVFGVYVNANGELRNIPDGQQSEVSKDFMKVVGKNVTPLENGWFEAALSGGKIGHTLPKIKEIKVDALQDSHKDAKVDPQTADNNQKKAEQKKKRVYNDVRYEINNAFFPAYRALKDSFSKRWWFEWIFNHKQYVAERDALKIMENLITSIGGYTKSELKAEYKVQKSTIAEKEIYPERFKKKVKEKPVEKQVEEPKQAPKKEPEPTTMLEKFKKLDGDEAGFFQSFMKDLSKAMHGVGINMSALIKSVPRHIYLPLSEHAKSFCKTYDDDPNRLTNPEQFKESMLNSAQKTAMEMFISAFKTLGSVDTMTQQPVFGEMSLKNRIMVAQNVTDHMHSELSPEGFDSEDHADAARGSITLDNQNQVRSIVKSEAPSKYTDEVIDAALNDATKDLGAMYRDQRAERPKVYEINYRPDPNDLKLEGKALIEAQKLVNGKNTVINDPALKAVINENVRRYKAIKDEKGAVITGAKKENREETWAENDKKLTATYPNYDSKAMDKLIRDTVAQTKANVKDPEKINVELPEPKAQVAPPVEKNPIEISAPNIVK